MTRHKLQRHHEAIHPDVYVPVGTKLTAVQRAYAAWLWSKRCGIVAGQSAAALHGAKWVDAGQPAQLIYGHRRPPPGIRTWSDTVADDEIQLIGDVPVTTAARTAFDLACRSPLGKAVAAVDALARATRLKTADVELLAEGHKGHRNIRRARRALTLGDAGAESPRETWLRLLVIEAGYRRRKPRYRFTAHTENLSRLSTWVGRTSKSRSNEGDHHRTDRRIFGRTSNAMRRYPNWVGSPSESRLNT